MRFIDLPQNDQKALQYHIECVKKEAKNNEIDICVYEYPTLYIIYINDEIFNAIESKINGILENGLKKYPKISKLILCSPKSFMISYEKKIELESLSALNINYPKLENFYLEDSFKSKKYRLEITSEVSDYFSLGKK